MMVLLNGTEAFWAADIPASSLEHLVRTIEGRGTEVDVAFDHQRIEAEKAAKGMRVQWLRVLHMDAETMLAPSLDAICAKVGFDPHPTTLAGTSRRTALRRMALEALLAEGHGTGGPVCGCGRDLSTEACPNAKDLCLDCCGEDHG